MYLIFFEFQVRRMNKNYKLNLILILIEEIIIIKL